MSQEVGGWGGRVEVGKCVGGSGKAHWTPKTGGTAKPNWRNPAGQPATSPSRNRVRTLWVNLVKEL